MVPAAPPRWVDSDGRLALALPAGAVLTRAHLSPEGPAAGLDPELRAVPLPVPPGLDIAVGAKVLVREVNLLVQTEDGRQLDFFVRSPAGDYAAAKLATVFDSFRVG